LLRCCTRSSSCAWSRCKKGHCKAYEYLSSKLGPGGGLVGAGCDAAPPAAAPASEAAAWKGIVGLIGYLCSKLGPGGGFRDAGCSAALTPAPACGAAAWNGIVGLIAHLSSKLGPGGGLVNAGCDASPAAVPASGAAAWKGIVGLIAYLSSKLGPGCGLVDAGCDASPAAVPASAAPTWKGIVGLIAYLSFKLGPRGGLAGAGCFSAPGEATDCVRWPHICVGPGTGLLLSLLLLLLLLLMLLLLFFPHMQRGTRGEGEACTRANKEQALQPRERTAALGCSTVLATSASPKAEREFAVQGKFSLSDCHSELHLCGCGDMLGVLAHICVGPGKLGSGVAGVSFFRCGGVFAVPAKSKFNIVGRSGEAGARALEAEGLACC